MSHPQAPIVGAPRQQPHNDEAERSVLGCILLDNAALDDDDVARLTPEDMYRPKHERALAAMLALRDAGEAIDHLTVAEELARRGALDAVGGIPWLLKLTTEVISTINVGKHARMIIAAAGRRRAIVGLTQQLDAAYAGEESPEAIEAISEDLAASTRKPDGALDMRTLLTSVNDTMHARQRGEVPLVISTGYPTIDASWAGGMRPGELIVIGGRPGTGKSALMVRMADHILSRGHAVYIAECEMSAQAIGERMIAGHAGMRLEAIRNGNPTKEEWRRYLAAAPQIVEWRLWTEETPGITLVELCARIRRQHRANGVRVVFIDYLQLIRVPGARSREQEIGEVSRTLKALARRLGVVIVAMAQLNRGVEHRAEKRPTSADLRESGQVEQDADMIAMLYRAAMSERGYTGPDVLEVITTKSREGQPGTAYLACNLACAQLTECDAPAPPAHEAGEKKQQYQSW